MKAETKASAFFDDVYKKNRTTHENIPWARKDVNPLLQEYLDSVQSHKGKALVIGCGLGDDAYALDKAGYDVFAIDISQTALDLAKERFLDANITFEKQDIFDMPQKYKESFDLVFEALTIQSLPLEFREKMILAISDTLKKDAKLLVVAHKHNGNNDGPPWPLTQEQLDFFKTLGMKEISFEIVKEESRVSNERFKVLYTK